MAGGVNSSAGFWGWGSAGLSLRWIAAWPEVHARCPRPGKKVLQQNLWVSWGSAPGLGIFKAWASVSGYGAGQGLPLPAEPPVPGALPAATRTGGGFHRIGRARERFRLLSFMSSRGRGCRFSLSGRARGSAPSRHFQKIFVLPARLLHLFRSPPALPVEEVLFVLVPPCFAARPGT